MNRHHDQTIKMGLQDYFAWRSHPAANEPAITDEETPADVDEPPDHRAPKEQSPLSDFHKSAVRQTLDRKESLLTKAFQQNPELEASKPEIQVNTDLTRRRSMMSNASLASTAELTSDGGLTSPARTNTPSPPFPNTTYTSFAPYSLVSKTVQSSNLIAKGESRDSIHVPEIASTSPKMEPIAPAPRKRCITFMCDGNKDMKSKATPAPAAVPQPAPVAATVEVPQPRRCTIKFACAGPQPSDKATKTVSPPAGPQNKPADNPKRVTTGSPTLTRKSPRPSVSRMHRDSSSTIRRVSPVAVRAKPKYIVADENSLQSSEATRFHEFASEEVQEDDWIRKDAEVPKTKLTINDTLEMENRIRKLGNEAEEEALEDEDDDDDAGNDSDDEGDSDSQDEVDDAEDLVEGVSDNEASDGNETDNEAGFAESDDETDEGEFAFWTPGRKLRTKEFGDTYRASAHRTASASSIDSLNHMEPPKGRMLRRRPIKIRPGTPDLPDSTDFVCGTLDEDRPLEEAYVSCMEARKYAKHKQTPQDIDPSFPTSDPEDEEDIRDQEEPANDSDEHVWIHGKFEESDEEMNHGRRRSTTAIRRKSPGHSPRRLHSPPPPRRVHSRLHSPPPPKQRLHSPPPRKLFGHSPKRMHSPPPARTIRSPPASPTQIPSHAVAFAPLGSRPGLTHTKSLPRTPNAFCRQYQASRLDAATGNAMDDNDGPTRGAIDIVKGLEQKRQRRKEKFYQKHCNRKNKTGDRPRPLPGKGAERMRELGLLMAGRKPGVQDQDPYMMSA